MTGHCPGPARPALTRRGSDGSGTPSELLPRHGLQAQGDYRRRSLTLSKARHSLTEVRRHERFGHPFLRAVSCRAWLAVCHANWAGSQRVGPSGTKGSGLPRCRRAPGASYSPIGELVFCPLHQGDLPRALPLLERAMGHLSGKWTSHSFSPGWLRPWAGIHPGRACRRRRVVAHASPGTDHYNGSGRLSGAL